MSAREQELPREPREPGLEERELLELLRPHRPDPRAFREGVARRVREREQAARRERSEPARASLARRVAALLPPQLAGALGSAGGGKGLSLALALPALVLVSTFGAFAAGVRSLRRTAREAELPPAEGNAPARTGARARSARARPLVLDLGAGSRLVGALHLASLAALLVSGLFGYGFALDVLCAALLVAMVALVACARALGRAGLLARGEVARLCVGVLASVLVGVFLWRQGLGLPDESSLGVGWPVSVVLCGLLACVGLARRAGAQSGLPKGWTGFLLAWLAFVVLLDPFGCTRSSPGALRASFPRLAASPAELSGWREAAATWEALRAAGLAAPDTAGLRARVEHALEAGEPAHPQVWTAAARMGLVDAAHWRLLAARELEAYALEQLVQAGARWNPTPYYEYRVPMLLAARPPSEAERAALVAKLERVLDGTDEPLALRPALSAVHALEWLGREDLVQARRASLRALLVRHWIPGSEHRLFARPGGFSAYPETIRGSLPEASWEGVELLARVGAPEAVDLRLLRGYLRLASHAFPLGVELAPELDALARAALLRLEREIGLPSRTPLERVLDERLLVAAALLVTLCLLAIGLAPRERPEPPRGALP